jgi:putative phage-type endonuclease
MATDHPTIGASQIAALMGCHPWLSIHQLWRSLVLGEKQDQNDAMARGVQMEPAIAALYQQACDLGQIYHSFALPQTHNIPLLNTLFVQDLDEPAKWVSRHLHATPDALRYHQNGSKEYDRVLAEFKTSNSSEGWGEPGTNQVPAGYLMQVQAQMDCTGIKQADLAVLLPHFDFRIYHVEAMPELQARLQQKAKEFIETYVLPKKMPPVDHTEACRENLLDLFPEPKEDYLKVEAGEAFERKLGLWKEHQAQIQALEQELELVKNEIREAIANHAGIQSELGRIDYKKPRPTSVVDYRSVAEALQEHLTHYEPRGELERLEKAFTSFKSNPRRLMPYWKKD